MNLFDSILLKVKQKIDTEDALKEKIITIITETIKVKLSKEVISLKDKTLIFSIAPTLKTTLFLKKELLIDALKKGGVEVTNIR